MHELARYNGKTSNLTLEQLLVVGGKTLDAGEWSSLPGREHYGLFRLGL